MARIYGEKVDLCTEDVKEFWERRSQKYDPQHPFIATKLSDNNSDFSSLLDLYEKGTLLPQLGIDKTKYVLDIGCGTGRLAETFISKTAFYLGIDFSAGLIEVANETLTKQFGNDGDFQFYVASFTELGTIKDIPYAGKYNLVVMDGVLQYINDADIPKCFEGLLELLAPSCSILFISPIARGERLTLKDWASNDFDGLYNSIYRSIDQYIQLFTTLFNYGFVVVQSEPLPQEFNRFSDTERYSFILKR